MDKIVEILYDKILATLIKVIGLVMVLSILAQIFTRSFLRVPFAWTDEVARFSFLYFCFLGGVMTLRYKFHLGIDFFESKMPEKGRFFNRIFVYSMVIAFGFFMGIYGTMLMDIVGIQLTPILRIPMRHVYLALPVAGFLYAFLGFYQLYCHLRGKPYKLPGQEPQTAKENSGTASATEGKRKW
ncbi:MAG: TRAP transporter small permease [Treponema sp.]|nr:TRAP transporter small permease [Treponema sp.]